MNTVLITGASGFVGQNLIKYLNSQDLILKSFPLREVPQPYNVQDVNSLIHLAGKAHDLNKVSSPEQYYEVNFELTKTLYDAFLRSNSKKFIFISSVKAAVDQVNSVLKENDIPNPKTHYGKSKLMAEEYIQSQPLLQGKSYYILRPCMIHGPGNKGNLNLLYKLISKGIPYPLAAFENKRSFLSIENLCFIIKEIIERDDIPSGVYNIADDVPLSTNEVIDFIAESRGKEARIFSLNKSFVSSLARLGDLLKLPLNTERLQKLTESYIVSNDKIKKALGKPLPISSKEGLMNTLESFSKK